MLDQSVWANFTLHQQRQKKWFNQLRILRWSAFLITHPKVLISSFENVVILTFKWEEFMSLKHSRNSKWYAISWDYESQ